MKPDGAYSAAIHVSTAVITSNSAANVQIPWFGYTITGTDPNTQFPNMTGNTELINLRSTFAEMKMTGLKIHYVPMTNISIGAGAVG